MSDQDELNDDGKNTDEMLEDEAREEVQRLLTAADWDAEQREVTIPSDQRSHPHIFTSIEELRQFLVEAYEEVWTSRAPFEEGAPLEGYEADGLDAVNEELEEYEDQIRSLGWRL